MFYCGPLQDVKNGTEDHRVMLLTDCQGVGVAYTRSRVRRRSQQDRTSTVSAIFEMVEIRPAVGPQRSSALTRLLLKKLTQGARGFVLRKTADIGRLKGCLFSMAESAEMPRFRPASSIHEAPRRQGCASPSRKARLALDPAPPH